MTTHLVVVAVCGGGEERSRPLDSLTPLCQLGLVGSYFPHCVYALDAQRIKISTTADRQTLVELGFGFSFPFILKNCSSANFGPKSGVTAKGTVAQERKLDLL